MHTRACARARTHVQGEAACRIGALHLIALGDDRRELDLEARGIVIDHAAPDTILLAHLCQHLLLVIRLGLQPRLPATHVYTQHVCVRACMHACVRAYGRTVVRT